MIQVIIYNCPDKDVRERLRRSTRFFIERLMPKKRTLKIKIFLNNNLLKDEKMSGSCAIDDDEYRSGKLNTFKIELDSTISFKDKLSILAHEMAHAKQYSTKQLRYSCKNPENSIWEGKEYVDEDVSYEDHPWEIDAVEKEISLFTELMQTDIWK